ncbi:hypothetical protein Hanom_Chr00s000007g01615721 [Helianthus anomalus]
MSTSSKPGTSKKRQTKPKDPPGPNRAIINWKEEEFYNLPTLDAPPGYMTLYATSFREGNYGLPMSTFLGEILTKYGIHLSQVNALELPRVTHFEFICRAKKLGLTFEMFNIFYYVTYTGDFYSFNSRTGGCPSEKALVIARTSLMWVPREPRATPVYAYKGKVGAEMMTMLLHVR